MSRWGSVEESNDFYDVLSSEWQHEYLPLDMVLPPPADLSPSSTWLPSINKFMVTKAKDILSLRLAHAALCGHTVNYHASGLGIRCIYSHDSY